MTNSSTLLTRPPRSFLKPFKNCAMKCSSTIRYTLCSSSVSSPIIAMMMLLLSITHRWSPSSLGSRLDRFLYNQDLRPQRSRQKYVDANLVNTRNARTHGLQTDRIAVGLRRPVKPNQQPGQTELLGFGLNRLFERDSYHAYMMKDG